MNLADSKKLFEKARNQLKKALADPILTDRDIAGVIQTFEFTYETCWKYLKARLEEAGVEARNPRDVFEASLKQKWLSDSLIWGNLLKDRNLTVHTYDQKFAKEMIQRIQTQYLPAFEKV